MLGAFLTISLEETNVSMFPESISNRPRVFEKFLSLLWSLRGQFVE